MFFSFLRFGTFSAQTGEGELAAGDGPSDACGCVAAQGLGYLQLRQVQDRVTAGADEVDMWLGVGIEPLDPSYSSHTLDQPLLFEQGQVAVHRCQGNVRVVLLQHGVDHICRRVGLGAPQALQDRAALTEVFGCRFHRATSYLRMIIIYN